MSNDVRLQIAEVLKSFEAMPLREAAMQLLNILGYQSDKTLDLEGSPEAFLEQFGAGNVSLRKDKAYFDDWESIEFLFQLTDEELSGQATLFDRQTVNTSLLKSYLFIAVKLRGSEYARGKLAQITRQINRLFSMPVMVLFEYDRKLSVAVINRRQNKRDEQRDVLGKVTLIQAISLEQPHRGHLDILASFSISELCRSFTINSFDTLHAAWEEIFNVELLNKKFYRELSNWYFWAMKHVHFPYDELRYSAEEMDKNDLFKDPAIIREHDAKNLIRLLTRLLFIWFIKEKGLVPEKLFDPQWLMKDLLKNFDALSKDTRYYKAVLQNLFFASLNQVCGKREFRRPGQHQNTTTLMRYESYFRDSEQFISMVEDVVPFMNGGLFECLDKPHPTLKGPQGGAKILYEDGFSDRNDNELTMPDFLFFGEARTVDLSDVYGDRSHRREKVRGLIPILNSYKFTIVENTPIEQEIALDPELLGKVFENLLASYNPETKTTARKQTGSFYTPRNIVNYMVDESLKAYFKKVLSGSDTPLMSEEDAEMGLEILFAYTEKEHAFSEAEKQAMIAAVDNCKILDPACGSGAFPMGILHKLEFILSKLDPQNRMWRDRQLVKVDKTMAAAEQIDDSVVRDNTLRELENQKQDIEESFANNELGYGRKLYLIENCIYGVDIQSIATQVSKLRFFISLMVDQTVNAEKDNFGIRPLPNLETKFVTADTLIHIEKPEAQLNLFDSGEVKALEEELKNVRHKVFSAKTPKTKNKYRQRDKELREQIARELEENGWSNASAHQLAHWDPYDQNASARFFDPEWMFDQAAFDVVIGNPPYIQIQKFTKEQKALWVKQDYQVYAATADIYCLFYERGVQLLEPGGHLYYITSNKWMRADYGDKLRSFLADGVNTTDVLDFGMAQNFGAATTYTCVVGLAKTDSQHATRCCYASDDKAAMADPEGYFIENSLVMNELGENSWVVITPDRYRIKRLVESQGVALEDWDIQINYGVKTGFNDAFYLTQQQRDRLVAKEPQASDIIVPLLRGRFVERYKTNWDGTWMISTFPAMKITLDDYPEVKKHLKAYQTRLEPKPRGYKDKDWPGRKTGSYKWYETQDTIAYHGEFSKPKVIYPNMTKYLSFYYDTQEHFFINDKAFIITCEKPELTYLIALLNSSLFRYCFRDNFPELMGNTYEVRKVFVEKIPIRRPRGDETKLFAKLVSLVQHAKRQGLADEGAFLEELIDAGVYELYFRDHMAERDLLFIDEVASELQPFSPDDPDRKRQEFLKHCYKKLSAPSSKIHHRLSRITKDSPDLLAVIMEEGMV